MAVYANVHVYIFYHYYHYLNYYYYYLGYSECQRLLKSYLLESHWIFLLYENVSDSVFHLLHLVLQKIVGFGVCAASSFWTYLLN